MKIQRNPRKEKLLTLSFSQKVKIRKDKERTQNLDLVGRKSMAKVTQKIHIMKLVSLVGQKTVNPQKTF